MDVPSCQYVTQLLVMLIVGHSILGSLGLKKTLKIIESSH